jgi:dUTP pyrophosphatase
MSTDEVANEVASILAEKKGDEALTLISNNAQVISQQLIDKKNRYNEFLNFEKMEDDAKVPIRESAGAAGYDFRAYYATEIPAWSRASVNTMLKVRMPPGHYLRMASRSSLARDHCIDVGAGVIDSDYQGEIQILLINNSDKNYLVKKHEKIAQGILEKISMVETKTVKSINEIFGATARGVGGFGSTGKF